MQTKRDRKKESTKRQRQIWIHKNAYSYDYHKILPLKTFLISKIFSVINARKWREISQISWYKSQTCGILAHLRFECVKLRVVGFYSVLHLIFYSYCDIVLHFRADSTVKIKNASRCRFKLNIYIYIYIYIYVYMSLAQRLECSPMAWETWVQSQVESYQRL